MHRTIPAGVRLAARRGFIRTTAQTLGATIPTGGITAAALSGADFRTVVVAVGAAGLSSLLAGAASALSITAHGIPEDYQPAPF